MVFPVVETRYPFHSPILHMVSTGGVENLTCVFHMVANQATLAIQDSLGIECEAGSNDLGRHGCLLSHTPLMFPLPKC